MKRTEAFQPRGLRVDLGPRSSGRPHSSSARWREPRGSPSPGGPTPLSSLPIRIGLESLQTHPAVASRIRQGRLCLQGWVYHIGTGDILAYQPDARAFLPLRSVVEVSA